MVASVVADALRKAEAQGQQEQADRDAAKAEYEAELARVSTFWSLKVFLWLLIAQLCFTLSLVLRHVC